MPHLITIVVTALAVLFFLRKAERWRLIDHPGEHREHARATPIIGGIAMFTGSTTGMLFLSHDASTVGSLILSGAVMLGVGIWDDRHDTSYLFRFLGQLVAAAVMIKSGSIVLDDLGYLMSDQLLPLNRWSVALTLFATVGVINAFNMSDGMDGLAGSLALVTLVSLFVVAYVSGHFLQANMVLIVAAAICVFLLFNMRIFGYSGARVFMGDAGSMWLGLVLSWFLVSLSQGEHRAMAPVTALWITAIPLFDAVGSLFRRAIRGRSPFHADRSHYHHYLIAIGLNVNGALFVVVACGIVFAALGVTAEVAAIPERTMFLSFLVLFGVYLLIVEFAEWKIRMRGAAGTK